MAKYTELLAEYLQGGGLLPASFSQIDGFENLFIGRYCDHEIGFETEELFKIKLETKAELLIPKYKKRIDLLTSYYTKAENPTKVFYERATTQYNMGQQKIKTTELPFDSATAEPNIINQNDAYQNDDNREVRREENGETTDEVMRMLEFLNKAINPLIEKLLNEFKDLFMGVY